MGSYELMYFFGFLIILLVGLVMGYLASLSTDELDAYQKGFELGMKCGKLAGRHEAKNEQMEEVKA